MIICPPPPPVPGPRAQKSTHGDVQEDDAGSGREWNRKCKTGIEDGVNQSQGIRLKTMLGTYTAVPEIFSQGNVLKERLEFLKSHKSQNTNVQVKTVFLRDEHYLIQISCLLSGAL